MGTEKITDGVYEITSGKPCSDRTADRFPTWAGLVWASM